MASKAEPEAGTRMCTYLFSAQQRGGSGLGQCGPCGGIKGEKKVQLKLGTYRKDVRRAGNRNTCVPPDSKSPFGIG